MMPWFIGSDQLLSIDGLRDPVTGNYVNSATISATMFEANGTTPVAGQTWPLTLGYVATSNGNYNGILDDARVLADGKMYWISITANAGGLKKEWRWSDVARHRTAGDS